MPALTVDQVIVRPLITEKNTDLMEHDQYTFGVATLARDSTGPGPDLWPGTSLEEGCCHAVSGPAHRCLRAGLAILGDGKTRTRTRSCRFGFINQRRPDVAR